MFINDIQIGVVFSFVFFFFYFSFHKLLLSGLVWLPCFSSWTGYHNFNTCFKKFSSNIYLFLHILLLAILSSIDNYIDMLLLIYINSNRSLFIKLFSSDLETMMVKTINQAKIFTDTVHFNGYLHINTYNLILKLCRK